MKILVTGGAGYIGSHTVSLLKRKGHDVLVLDNMVQGHALAVEAGVPIIQGNVGDEYTVLPGLDGIDGVIHFAAHTSVAESVEDPQRYYQNNLVETLSLISALRDEALIRGKHVPLVFSSTAATYGAVDQDTPIIEETRQDPINPYGFGKFAVERVLSDFYHAYGTPSISFRYFNAAGADPSGRNGEMHNPETHLIPLVLRAIRDGGSIKVFGTDYDTPDGTCVRDYIHVEDLARAHVKGLEYLLECGGCKRLNLGTGHGYSVKEVIDTALYVTKGKLNIIEDERRAGDPPFLVADPSMAKAILGWEPERSDLELIIKDAWQWHRNE